MSPTRRPSRPRLLRLFAILVPTLALGVAGCGDDSGSATNGGAAGGGGGGAAAGGPPPAFVKVAEVEQVELEPRRSLTGNLRAVRRSRVAVIEPGRVEEVNFTEGQRVAEGDLLVRLDARRLREQVAEADAEVAVAEANLGQRQAELERARADLESREAAAKQVAGAVSEADLRQFRTAASVAEASVNAADKQLAAVKARVNNLNVRLEDVAVMAPFDGVILSQQTEVGEYLSAGSVVGEIVSVGVFEAFLEAPESIDYAMLAGAAASEVKVTIDSTGQELTPTSVRVVPDVNPRSRRYLLIATIEPGAEQPLAAGMSVTASVPTRGTESRLTVPADAVRRDGAGAFVFMAAPGGPGGAMSAVPVGVSIDYTLDGRSVIADNPQLQPGTAVVTEGGERLRPGQSVSVASPTAPAE